jgi:F-type H+-transporting ATPase subunit delta
VAKDAGGVTGLAGRYATALFELADEGDTLDRVEADLAVLKSLLSESADLTRLVRSPVLSRAEQSRAMMAILGKASAADLTRRFVGLLAERRRLFVLADIIGAFERLAAAHRGEVRAEVTSAIALDDEQLGTIRAALRKVVGGNVVVETEVDDGLIGGLVVRVGSRMVDASVRTKLERLHLVMKGVG